MKNEQLIIRKATEHDIGTLLQFEQEIIKAERPFDITLKTEPTYYHDLQKMISAENIYLIVAELGNKLIASGYARITNAEHYLKHDKHAYLGMMYVVPEHRGKSINKKIIDELITWSNKKNVHEFRLLVYDNNSPAVNAYEKAGFAKHVVEMRMSS
ncbi:MAG: GNAT family N-acetyltransferase [Bacteroidetes bacterium]|nr:GNAT family N-acetyltransferase [Bacteroidota bacterium]